MPKKPHGQSSEICGSTPKGAITVDHCRLMQAALEDGTRRGITFLLQEIALQTHSFGCILWRATKDADLRKGEGELTMLASWFAVDPQTKEKPQHDFIGIRRVPVQGSVSGGAAMSKRRPIYCTSLKERLNGKNAFISRFQIEKLVAHRFTFEDGRVGVISLYRALARHATADLHPEEHFCANDFGRTEGNALSEISKALPLLYRAVHQQASTDLLVRVGAVVRNDNLSERNLAKRVGGEVARTFSAIETSIFFEDVNESGSFICAWTNDGPHSEACRRAPLRPSLGDGFTRLSLYAKEPVRVHDTMDSTMERDHWRSLRYPEFDGHHPKGTSAEVDAYFGNPDPRPPYSLLCVPLISDGRLLGCLRCWVATIGPAYFSSDDEKLMMLVADTLAHAVGTLRIEKSRERAFANLSKRSYKGKDDPDKPYFSYLELVDSILTGSHANTVRLVDGDVLRYHVFPRPLASTPAISAVFPLNGESLGARAVATRRVQQFRANKPSDKTEILAETERMIVVPIMVEGSAVGVLDVRARSASELPKFAESLLKALCELLGSQLSRVQAFEERSKAEKERYEIQLEAIRKQFAQEKAMQEAFEDVSHQIKSPLAEVARRVRDLAETHSRSPLGRDFTDIAGLLKRAELTAKLIGLFSAYARGERNPVQGKKIEAVALVKVVGEILLNQRPKLDPVRGIRFEFDADYIYRHCPADFHGDLELLYQAITNLVDNAVKYTYKNTVITVRAGKTKSERFFLSVRNKGLPISSKEAIDFKKRNSRGDLARLVTGEGNGLGLFIADKIMHAHGGELYILATDTSGFNEFRLIFPL